MKRQSNRVGWRLRVSVSYEQEDERDELYVKAKLPITQQVWHGLWQCSARLTVLPCAQLEADVWLTESHKLARCPLRLMEGDTEDVVWRCANTS